MTAPSDDSTISTTRHGGLPRGYALREFRIERVLGEGGFGVVYEATDTRLERRIAIKEYMPAALAMRDIDFSVHPRSSADLQEAFAAGLRSFINEAKLLARFEHPALIKVYQFWQEKGTAYMVMPFYSAPTFKQWIRQRRPLPEPWLIAFLDGVMDAIEALHRENCLHRDVAPDNVLVINDAAPLLLDFGAARRVIGDLTHALTAILKPGFAPIEQYAESAALRQGPWTDVYGLAAIGYFAIAGKAPPAAVSRMVSDEMAPLRMVAAGRYSDRLLAALDAGLAVKPEQRPQSIAALRALISGEAVSDDERTLPATSGTPLPAPAALHSTFKPPADAAEDDRTRRWTTAPAARSSAPTAPLSADPTRKMTRSAGVTAPAPKRPVEAPHSDSASRYGALAWAGVYAALGAAIVLGISTWLDRGSPPSPAPAASPAPAPVTDVPVQVIAPPALPPTAPPVIEESAQVAAPRRVTPVEVPAMPPAAAPVEQQRLDPSVVAAKKPAPTATAAPADKPKTPVRPAEPAGKAPPAQLAETQKPAPEPKAAPAPPAPRPAPQLRAPEGPRPLEVTDDGITPLHVASTVKPGDKEPLFSGFTCCNLHYSGDWISDLNYSSSERVAAGTPIKITGYGRWRIHVELGGKKMRIGLDYGRRQETLAQYARKLTVDQDLRFRMGSLPPLVQDAIAAGRLLPGMSREQVVMAVGFPPRHETPSVNDAKWKLWHSSRVPYYVTFDERGRVKEIEIDPALRANVVYEGK